MNNWIEKYYTVLKDEFKEHFGHNTEFNFLPKFKKLSKISKGITIIDGDTIKVKLPENAEETLLYVLTNLPSPSYTSFSKRNKELTLEWHY